MSGCPRILSISSKPCNGEDRWRLQQVLNVLAATALSPTRLGSRWSSTGWPGSRRGWQPTAAMRACSTTPTTSATPREPRTWTCTSCTSRAATPSCPLKGRSRSSTSRHASTCPRAIRPWARSARRPTGSTSSPARAPRSTRAVGPPRLRTCSARAVPARGRSGWRSTVWTRTVCARWSGAASRSSTAARSPTWPGSSRARPRWRRCVSRSQPASGLSAPWRLRWSRG